MHPNIRKIKGVAQKNGDVDGTCKLALLCWNNDLIFDWLTFFGTFSEFSRCVFLLFGETFSPCVFLLLDGTLCSGFRLVAFVPAACVRRPSLSFSELLSASVTTKYGNKYKEWRTPRELSFQTLGCQSLQCMTREFTSTCPSGRITPNWTC